MTAFADGISCQFLVALPRIGAFRTVRLLGGICGFAEIGCRIAGLAARADLFDDLTIFAYRIAGKGTVACALVTGITLVLVLGRCRSRGRFAKICGWIADLAGSTGNILRDSVDALGDCSFGGIA